MTVGQKIKMIRCLKGLTQKELGLMVGFPSSTADNRIRQYEMGKMIPKADKLQEIADALEVDVSSLSSINISSHKDIIKIFFELEREHGLRIEKQNEGYYLSFNLEHKDGTSTLHALDVWYNTRQHFFSTPEDEDNPSKVANYQLWTHRYPLNVEENERNRLAEVNYAYSKSINLIKRGNYKVDTISDCILVYEKLLKAGINLEISIDNSRTSTGSLVSCTSFSHNELLALPDDAANDYAEFECMIDYLISKGIVIERDTHSFNNDTFTDFFISDSTISTAINTVVKDMKKDFTDGHFYDEDVQSRYKDNLKKYNVTLG